MEIKKSKITESKFPFTKQEGVDDFGMPKQVPEKDDYGNVTLSITLENGDNGLLKAQKNFERFKVGEELEYTIEEKESKAGKKYNMLRLPKKDGGYSGGGGGSKYQPKKKIAYKADMIGYGFAYAKDMFIADKLPEGVKLADMATAYVKNMWKLLDEIEGLE
jgi:hypothetical protein